jgi:hypothetical protein
MTGKRPAEHSPTGDIGSSSGGTRPSSVPTSPPAARCGVPPPGHSCAGWPFRGTRIPARVFSTLVVPFRRGVFGIESLGVFVVTCLVRANLLLALMADRVLSCLPLTEDCLRSTRAKTIPEPSSKPAHGRSFYGAFASVRVSHHDGHFVDAPLRVALEPLGPGQCIHVAPRSKEPCTAQAMMVRPSSPVASLGRPSRASLPATAVRSDESTPFMRRQPRSRQRRLRRELDREMGSSEVDRNGLCFWIWSSCDWSPTSAHAHPIEK